MHRRRFRNETMGIRLLLPALAANSLDLIATYFYYKALRSGEAYQTLAVMGGLTPLATAFIGIPLLNNRALHGLTRSLFRRPLKFSARPTPISPIIAPHATAMTGAGKQRLDRTSIQSPQRC